MTSINVAYIITHPNEVGADTLVSALSGMEGLIPLPKYSMQLWKKTDTGNCRTWLEYGKNLFSDKENFGTRVKELERIFGPILQNVIFKEEEEENYTQLIKKALSTERRLQKSENFSKMAQEILLSGTDPKEVTAIIRTLGGGQTEEEERLLKLIEEIGSEKT